VCRRGPVVATAVRLARESGAQSVFCSFAYDAATLSRQRALQSALEEEGLRATLVHDAPAVSPEDTAAVRSEGGGSGYRSFAPYFAAWSSQPRTPFATRLTFAAVSLKSESLPDPIEFATASFENDNAPAFSNARPPAHSDGRSAALWDVRGAAPSEQAALAALDAYLAGPGLAYSSARAIPAGEPTSRLSAALGLGTIAARTVLARVEQRARDPFLLAEERFALQAFTRAIARRDFFLQLAWFFEERPDAPLQERMRRFPFAATHPQLPAWQRGRTGFPLVDAGIRQLLATGWMHPRARLVAASFLCFDLGVDWRVGRDFWETQLEEDDPALATGNWQWVAGVGADLAQFPRIYNPRKQARALDPAGTYVRRYVAELANVPEQHFITGRTEEEAQLRLPLYADAAYPAPILDHGTEARAFLRRYSAFTTST
jgi:deoxyribodipyrimidine photo-lyase